MIFFYYCFTYSILIFLFCTYGFLQILPSLLIDLEFYIKTYFTFHKNYSKFSLPHSLTIAEFWKEVLNFSPSYKTQLIKLPKTKCLLCPHSQVDNGSLTCPQFSSVKSIFLYHEPLTDISVCTFVDPWTIQSIEFSRLE